MVSFSPRDRPRDRHRDLPRDRPRDSPRDRPRDRPHWRQVAVSWMAMLMDDVPGQPRTRNT